MKIQKVREDTAKERIFSLLPEEQKQELMKLFDEFEELSTPESKFANAMDNLQVSCEKYAPPGASATRMWRFRRSISKKN